ncbi:hypothetical protein I6N90_19765 [Paenibacillus sp. GSMTC-2017]|uniref:hypothetical protein n=1 Tax=Paenibacillus sp. GSMTC-2017 TaxID=2794350 RepID=UPI0018D69265|nr:hypothetical protein [Paenibacillus sp. GSMTC-2017]MBH5320043.1 hypothetical protein [Paenibacillus sp. GSMTC-2017]
MDSKKTVLISISYLVDIEENENQHILVESAMNHLSNDNNLEFDNKKKLLKWIETSSKELRPTDMNCGKCENCGGWTTDREKEAPILQLCNGASLAGRLLCDECLPDDHPWAF